MKITEYYYYYFASIRLIDYIIIFTSMCVDGLLDSLNENIRRVACNRILLLSICI
jgi:hypothetical protein